MIESDTEKRLLLARGLVAAATEEGLTLRVLGGVGIYLVCPSLETHPGLRRTLKDIDLIAPRSEFEAIGKLFEARGHTVKSKQKAEWTFEAEGIEVELTPPDFTEDHRLDLAPRLALSSPTVPMADLLLVKLQRVRFADKDLLDSIALLLDHRVTAGGDGEQIDSLYIAKLCARDWRLFSTVYDNTVTMEKVLDKHVEPEEGQLIWKRIELIQGEMDRQPKSLGWMVNQIIRRPAQVPS